MGMPAAAACRCMARIHSSPPCPCMPRAQVRLDGTYSMLASDACSVCGSLGVSPHCCWSAGSLLTKLLCKHGPQPASLQCDGTGGPTRRC